MATRQSTFSKRRVPRTSKNAAISVHSIGMMEIAPYGVFLNGEEIATYSIEEEAEEHYAQLRVLLVQERARKALEKLFLPQERPSFEIVRSTGACRLWRSRTVTCELHGYVRQPRVRYHITNGEELGIVLMPRLDMAILNFQRELQESAPDAQRRLQQPPLSH